MKTNISYTEAREIVLKEAKVFKTEIIPLEKSLNRRIAEDVFATHSNPQNDNSAMDGYAVRVEDVRVTPAVLKVTYGICAGDIPKTPLKKGEAIEIMTGALIPKGADAVIPFENTLRKEEGDDCTVIFKSAKKYENIRRKGEDYKKGELIIKKGVKINPSHIALLASIGRSKVKTFCRPTVSILATGSELLSINKELKEGKIYDSNSYGIAAQVEAENCIPFRIRRVKDNHRLIEEAIKKGLEKDVLIISGGISMGKADYVKSVLKDLGSKFLFSKVRQRPGNPFTFAEIKGKPVFLLPGNPVSAQICFEVYIRHFLRKISGCENEEENYVNCKMGSKIKVKKGKTYFLRVFLKKIKGENVAFLTGPQGSGIITSLTKADGILIVPEDVEEIDEGSFCSIVPLSWR